MAGQVHPDAPSVPEALSATTTYSAKMPGAAEGSPLPPPATYSKPCHRRQRGVLGGCCCCLLSSFCSLLIAFLILAGVSVLILWLVLKPMHLPNYSLDNVEIGSFSLGRGSTLNADFVYNITADNPNRKIGIKYDIIYIDTSYDSQVFDRSTIPSFYQSPRNITCVASTLKVKDFALNANSARILSGQMRSSSVPLHVRADAKVHVKIGTYTCPGFWVRVDCDVSWVIPRLSSLAKLANCAEVRSRDFPVQIQDNLV